MPANAAPSAPDTPARQAARRLRDPAEIRRRCAAIAAHVDTGASAHFTLDRTRLDAVAGRIAKLCLARFPTLRIPYHSRWRHFEAGGVDRKERLDHALAELGAPEAARARIDLTVVSVLLDAGAGPTWRYQEPSTDAVLTRSEGLAVATFDAFLSGEFSSDPARPCRVDADALMALEPWHLSTIFQVHDGNPLVGLDGRTHLMHRLGAALGSLARHDGGPARPGRLYDTLLSRLDPATRSLKAADILAALLDATSAIWPSGQWLGTRDGQGPDDQPLGDVWPHPAAGGAGLDAGLVPFHKLSQWLTYSLLEPFEWAGIPVTGLDALTGLPEYRNGGLLLDAGVIVPRDAAALAEPHTPADPWVIEWRALTVALLDELAPRVRAELGVNAGQLPLACMLEGGSWAAGRQIAAERRLGGPPPVRIDSDGTVF
ncbi:URC4/urg3 family protein [Leptothrix discophora]|uniref:URC4/urg3 family protein n=1 Tax=Leptothrix discophora TaxID=89 RepID=A0ABT9G991_LEPDI|nr:URC4/urg3 family protein [Leptothrix discophora]MDP4303000.1 URC4/urg3 family protein [Leptothrix discophora]